MASFNHAVVLATILIFIFGYSTFANGHKDEDTLKLVAAVFRHGDRANDAATTYPNDPYANETYFPYGLGQLTNKGRRTEYKLGKKLRFMYDKFLGKLYTPEVLDAVSTEMNRTKASLALVLAGLYPPKGTLLDWEEELDWQPIPYNYLLFTEDHLMSFPVFYCPYYATVYEGYRNSLDGQKIEQKYSHNYPYLSEHTGMNVTSLLDLFTLYFGLTSQKEWGLELPEWTKEVYPEYLQNGAADFYVLSSGNAQLKQMSGGFLLKKIINDIKLKLTNELVPKNRKLFLYSGHEINVAYILRAMEVFTPHIPPYGACVIIEVHTIKDNDVVKVYYEDYSGPEPKLLTIPGCGSLCPFKTFVKLLSKNLPKNDNACDGDAEVLQKYVPSRKRYLGI